MAVALTELPGQPNVVCFFLGPRMSHFLPPCVAASMDGMWLSDGFVRARMQRCRLCVYAPARFFSHAALKGGCIRVLEGLEPLARVLGNICDTWALLAGLLLTLDDVLADRSNEAADLQRLDFEGVGALFFFKPPCLIRQSFRGQAPGSMGHEPPARGNQADSEDSAPRRVLSFPAARHTFIIIAASVAVLAAPWVLQIPWQGQR